MPLGADDQRTRHESEIVVRDVVRVASELTAQRSTLCPTPTVYLALPGCPACSHPHIMPYSSAVGPEVSEALVTYSAAGSPCACSCGATARPSSIRQARSRLVRRLGHLANHGVSQLGCAVGRVINQRSGLRKCVAAEVLE